MGRLEKYGLDLINGIYDAKDYPTILGTWSNKLNGVWFRNYKEVIKFESSVIIKGLKSNLREDEKGYHTNFYMDITPEQAETIIKDLQKILVNRKKNKKVE